MVKVGAWTVMAMNEDEDLFAEGPVCDFCKIAVDPDESLEPIYIGEMPQPKPHYLSEVAPRDGRRGTRVGGSEFHLLGRPIGIYQAMYQALENCNDIEVNESNRVEEVKAVGGETHYADLEHGSVPEPTQFETNVHSDKVGVSLKIRPKDVTYEPDAEVCDVCAEMFKNL